MRNTIDIGPSGQQFHLHPRLIVAAVLVILALLVVSSLLYSVDTESVGVVMRFGRYLKTTEPGLHMKLPLGIDRVTQVKTQRQEKQEFGFRTMEAGVQTRYLDHTQDPRLLDESLMVTGDLNAAVVEWIVQYRIDNPRDYLFNVRKPEETLRDTAESVMRQVVGDRTVDEVLTVGRQDIEVAAREELQKLMNEYAMGIHIEQLQLQDVNPPDKVKPSFNDVNQAQQEREKTINEARAKYNAAVPRASGEAEQKIQEAEGYALQRTNEAEGDAEKFNAVFAAYQKAPGVTRKRIYLETMGDVLPAAGRKFVVDPNAPGLLPFLQLQAGEEVKK